MDRRTTLLVGIILICIGIAAAGDTHTKKCGKDEEFKTCGSECPQTCHFLGQKCASTKCVKGCFCIKGHVRNKKGECVKISKVCCKGAHETYNKCAPSCEPSCTFPYKKCTGCEKKCVCKSGYVRNINGKCVHLETCPPWKCLGDHEEFLTCGKPKECVPSCANLKPADNCAAKCARGCYCTNGFVRNSDGVCIKPATCPTLIECS